MSTAAASNLVISLVAMQLARKIPFDDPQILNYIRIAYVTVQVAVLAAYYLVSQRINKKNDQTILKYVDQQNPMSGQPGQLVTVTVKDYDLQETSKAVRSTYMGVAMMLFLHIYMKYTQPLFIQSLMGLKNLYDAKVVAIHLLGKPAEGDLKRPFKTPSLFGGQNGPQTDKAAIDEAEKRIGKKDD